MLRLQDESESGARVTGDAQVIYNATNATLSVSIRARGFLPGTAHAVHIHAGSCQNQGAVLYMLPDLTADANGEIDTRMTLDGAAAALPASGWYLNIHQGSSAEILQNGEPALKFRPLLCADGQSG
jgi:hypothetical protein